MASDMTKMIPPVSTTSNTDGSDTASSLDAMAYDKAGDAARLMEIFERIVKARGESRAQFGRRAGLGKAANVSHYLNGKNNLSVESARKFAAHIPCKIEDFSPHWARMAHASGQVAISEYQSAPLSHGGGTFMVQEPINTYLSHSGTTLRMPLLQWARIDLMTEENESLVGLAEVEFVDADGEAVGPKTKFVDMPDDSMSPRIERGDRLTIEPDWVAEPGEIVLIKDKHGEFYIRRFKHVRPGHFVAEPSNKTDYESLDSLADELEIIAVVTARREFLAKRKR